MKIKIKSKQDDIISLSAKLSNLSKILLENNLLPTNISIKDENIAVLVTKIDFASMFSNCTHELTETYNELVISTKHMGIKFYCKQDKKPKIVTLSAQELTNESWSI